MIVKYDEKDEKLLHELLDCKGLSLGLDVEKCDDCCYKVTYTIRQGCDIVKSDSIKLRRK